MGQGEQRMKPGFWLKQLEVSRVPLTETGETQRQRAAAGRGCEQIPTELGPC